MQKKSLVIIAITIFLMAILYWKDNTDSVDNIKSNQSYKKNDDQSINSKAPQEKFSADAASTDSTQIKNQPIVVADLDVNKQFATSLKTISQCLQIKSNTDLDLVEPTFENLISSIKPAFGDVTVFTDDWDQFDVVFPDGITKRIRTEINYDNPGNPTKYLQVYKLNEQNIPEMEDLDSDKSGNASDEYIESMKSGSNTILHEKGGRAYFQAGEEMVIIERNGKLDSFSVTKNNKTISCSSMSSATSNCQCF